jgi:hypothetical protein
VVVLGASVRLGLFLADETGRLIDREISRVR